MPWTDYIDEALAAYGAYQGAQQANKPRNTTTNQTTTQRPYAEGLIAPDVQAAIDYQRQLMAAGPRYIGTGGGGARGGGGGNVNTSAAGPARGGGRSSGGAATWTNARGQLMTLDARGRAVPAGSGNTLPGGSPSPTAPRGIDDISNEVARRALDAGNDPTTNAARQGVRNILSGQGGAGSGSGFQGYNPIDDWLAGELQSDVGSRNAADLIRQFLGVGSDGTYHGDGGGGGASSGGRGVSYGPPAYVQQMTGGTTGGGNGGVPDTVGNSNSYFATQLRQLMDSGANDADLQAIIDASNADTRRGMQSDLWALDAQAQGTGRFGGDMWAGLAGQARADANREMATNASRARLAEQESRRAMYQNLLGQVNTRDLGAMNDATQRYGIDASSRASSAGASEAAALQRRGQDLQALMGLLGHDEYNVGALGGLGEQLSGDQLAAMGLSVPLAGIGLSGLGAANNAVGNLVGAQGNQVALRNAQIAAGSQRAALNQQAQLYNAQAPQDMVNNYLRNIGLVGGMGGTSTTSGTNVVPGLGINPWNAALMAGGAQYYGSR